MDARGFPSGSNDRTPRRCDSLRPRACPRLSPRASPARGREEMTNTKRRRRARRPLGEAAGGWGCTEPRSGPFSDKVPGEATRRRAETGIDGNKSDPVSLTAKPFAQYACLHLLAADDIEAAGDDRDGRFVRGLGGDGALARSDGGRNIIAGDREFRAHDNSDDRLLAAAVVSLTDVEHVRREPRKFRCEEPAAGSAPCLRTHAEHPANPFVDAPAER